MELVWYIFHHTLRKVDWHIIISIIAIRLLCKADCLHDFSLLLDRIHYQEKEKDIMSNVVLQLERLADGSIDVNANVLYDSIVVISDFISYDSGTGIITLLQPGRYEFDWWVATQSSRSVNGVGFALVSSQEDILIGNSPIKTGEVVGIGIIVVTEAPVTVELRNNSTESVYYPTIVPVKSSLVVIGGEGAGETGPTGPTGATAPLNLCK
jgi:hypothetical protein